MKKYQALQILKESGFKVIRESEEDFESYLEYVDSAFEKSGGIDDYHDSGVDLDKLARACYEYGLSPSEAVEKLRNAAKNGLKRLNYRISDAFDEDLYDIMDWNNLELCKKLVDVMQTANARTTKGIKSIYNVINGGIPGLKSKREREKEENIEFINWLKSLMAKYGITIEDLWEFGVRDLDPEQTLPTSKYSAFPFGTMYYREENPEKLKSKRKIYVTRLIRKIDELRKRYKLIDSIISYLNRRDPKRNRWRLVNTESAKAIALCYVLGISTSAFNNGEGTENRKTEYSGNTESLSDYEFMKGLLGSIVTESSQEREDLEKIKKWVDDYFNR